MTLIDERDPLPLRKLIGRLISTAKTADVALGHLRLAGLDLDESEFGVRCCRLLIGQFNADHIAAAQQSRLLASIDQDSRLEIRTAPHHVWAPDFSIFRDLPDSPDVLLFGAHYFGRPYPLFGLALTLVTTEPADIAKCAARFDELWAAGYDVLPVIRDAVHRG